MKPTLEEYCKRYEKCVIYWANVYNKKLSLKNVGLQFNDLYQTGYVGLLESYYNYDSSKSSISTYVNICIHYKILDYIQSNNYITYLPKGLRYLPLQLQKKQIDFYNENHRNMTITEILEYFEKECYIQPEYNVNEEFAKIICQLSAYHIYHQGVSLEDMVQLEDDTIESLKDTLANDVNVEEEAITQNTIEDILNYLDSHYSETDKNIFLETFGYIDEIPKTVRYLAKKYQISFQSINKHYHKILNKVKKYYRI